jgi:hypothetical protein
MSSGPSFKVVHNKESRPSNGESERKSFAMNASIEGKAPHFMGKLA